MTARLNSHAWRCDLPGCRNCGAGYPSERAADAAKRRHVDRHPRPRTEVTQ